ncbi:uncharacterized protein RHIMIDRAFT_242366 [Rhizopus microsporus ATCC 52813]|uniref:Uncharacterized protein n=1 Tax=Rhizopus microsporus ATCC 52813 TaxID=1340429 RepID=A0A2G4SG17_RHIZD|nr:uncharacterized protein RHIMIDRAFT_242366 [Rhizopus microsporus ATCC 52813]PHZ07712.1 hypothetical protein RHIMIDRAFT_242366 [Rhizopus microsporus ATCC 52813]
MGSKALKARQRCWPNLSEAFGIGLEDGDGYDDWDDLATKLNALNGLVVEEVEVGIVQITRILSFTSGATQDGGEKEEARKSSKEWSTSSSTDIFLNGDWNTTKRASDGLLSKEDIITERDHLQEKVCDGTEQPLQKPLKNKKEMLLDYMFDEKTEYGFESAVAYRPTGYRCSSSVRVATETAATILREPPSKKQKIDAAGELQSCTLATEGSSIPKLSALQPHGDK